MAEKGDRTKKRILDAARQRFHLNGYTNTSVEEILKSSRVKKGNFYFHYKSKEALGYAVIESHLAEQGERMRSMLVRSGDPVDRLFGVFDDLTKRMSNGGCRGGCPIGNFALEMSDVHEGFRRRVNRCFRDWIGMIQKVLDEARAAGRLGRSVDTAALASLVLASFEGAVMLAKTERAPKAMVRCAESLRYLIANSAGVKREVS